MATTTDLTLGNLTSTAGRGQVRSPTVTVDTAMTPKGIADVDQLFQVYPGDIVLKVSAEVQTIEGETATALIGDATDPNGFLDALNLETIGWHIPAGTEAYSTIAHKVYAAADTIDVTWVTATEDCKVRFTAYILGA